MAANIHRVGYERRLAAVEQLLYSLGLQSSKISTIAYDEQYQFPFNNYLYKVELPVPASSSLFPGTQPGTTKAPSDGIYTLVIKLSNAAVDGLNNFNRIENDVAAQQLVRQSMAQVGLAPLIPAIYAWASTIATDTNTNTIDERGFGWIISELKYGVDLDSEFSSLKLEDQQQVINQIATILKAIQAAKLPEGVTKFGGLTFDADGRITSGEATLFKGEPVMSYSEWRINRLYKKLQEAGQSPVIQGWKSKNINTRVENFLTGGGPEKVLAGINLYEKVLIHGDFTTNNMLYDTNTKQIIAVLDFDWAYISNPFEEFLSGLHDIGGNISITDDKVEAAILSGNFDMPPVNLDKESSKRWGIAKAWNTVMQQSGIISPSGIKGVNKICDLLYFQKLLCPFQLSNPYMLNQINDEKKTELRAKTETDLVRWLEKHGF